MRKVQIQMTQPKRTGTWGFRRINIMESMTPPTDEPGATRLREAARFLGIVGDGCG